MLHFKGQYTNFIIWRESCSELLFRKDMLLEEGKLTNFLIWTELMVQQQVSLSVYR